MFYLQRGKTLEHLDQAHVPTLATDDGRFFNVFYTDSDTTANQTQRVFRLLVFRLRQFLLAPLRLTEVMNRKGYEVFGVVLQVFPQRTRSRPLVMRSTASMMGC